MRRSDVSLADLYLLPPRNGIYKKKEFRGSGVKMVNMGELFANDSISNQEMERVELSNDEQAKYLVEDGDLLFGRRSLVEAGAGKCSILKDPLEPTTFESSIIRVRLDKTKVEPLYLFYFFASPEGRGKIRSIVTGTNVKGIRLTVLGTLSVTLPDLVAQRRIASILSAYDDLVENNVRRIKLLEQSARLLYDEWFARLRFPGHEHTRIVKGVPEGWETFNVPDLIEINPRTVPPEGEILYVPMASLSERSMTVSFKEMEKRAKPTGAKFRNGDILFPRITPCLENGKTAFVNFLAEGEIACGSTEFIVLRGKKVTPEFVYSLARTYEFRENAIKSMIGSSGRQRVQETCFGEFRVILPPRLLLDQFEEITSSIFKMIAKLHFELEKLKQARNILLPKLMSQEIEL